MVLVAMRDPAIFVWKECGVGALSTAGFDGSGGRLAISICFRQDLHVTAD